MRKYNEIIFSVLNILLIFLVIIGIVIGLYFLGIFKLPDFVKRLIDPNFQTPADSYNNNKEIYESIADNNENKIQVVFPQITKDNLKELLQSITPIDNYYQEASTKTFYNGTAIEKKVTIRCQNSLYQASVFDSNGTQQKEIQQYNDYVDISYFDLQGKQGDIVTLQNGNFNISDECGVVVNHEMFLESLTEISDSSYSFEYESFGTVVKLSFDTTFENYTQKQIYWLSLDYGIVVKAQSYENDVLVYQTETIVLNSIN